MSNPTPPHRGVEELDPNEPLLVTPEQLSTILASVETSSTFTSSDESVEEFYTTGYQEGACQMQLAVLEHAQRVDEADYEITPGP